VIIKSLLQQHLLKECCSNVIQHFYAFSTWCARYECTVTMFSFYVSVNNYLNNNHIIFKTCNYLHLPDTTFKAVQLMALVLLPGQIFTWVILVTEMKEYEDRKLCNGTMFIHFHENYLVASEQQIFAYFKQNKILSSAKTMKNRSQVWWTLHFLEKPIVSISKCPQPF
jgi:hypothetical protein